VPKKQIIHGYIVEGFLGSGTFGNVVEVSRQGTEERFALKIVRADRQYREQAEKETSLLLKIRKCFPEEDCLSQIIESFSWSYQDKADSIIKPSQCILFRKFNMNLTQLLRGNTSCGIGITMAAVSHVASQLCHALKCLREIGIIHRDVKPDNVMIREPPVGDRINICLIDFGSATTSDEPDLKTYVQSRFYRAPEVMLGHRYSIDVDMWSFGCVVVEMAFGKPLYLGQTEAEQLNLIHQLQGPLPQKLVERATSPLALLFEKTYCYETQEIVYCWRGAPFKHYWSRSSL